MYYDYESHKLEQNYFCNFFHFIQFMKFQCTRQAHNLSHWRETQDKLITCLIREKRFQVTKGFSTSTCNTVNFLHLLESFIWTYYASPTNLALNKLSALRKILFCWFSFITVLIAAALTCKKKKGWYLSNINMEQIPQWLMKNMTVDLSWQYVNKLSYSFSPLHIFLSFIISVVIQDNTL